MKRESGNIATLGLSGGKNENDDSDDDDDLDLSDVEEENDVVEIEMKDLKDFKNAKKTNFSGNISSALSSGHEKQNENKSKKKRNLKNVSWVTPVANPSSAIGSTGDSGSSTKEDKKDIKHTIAIADNKSIVDNVGIVGNEGNVVGNTGPSPNPSSSAASAAGTVESVENGILRNLGYSLICYFFTLVIALGNVFWISFSLDKISASLTMLFILNTTAIVLSSAIFYVYRGIFKIPIGSPDEKKSRKFLKIMLLCGFILLTHFISFVACLTSVIFNLRKNMTDNPQGFFDTYDYLTDNAKGIFVFEFCVLFIAFVSCISSMYYSFRMSLIYKE